MWIVLTAYECKNYIEVVMIFNQEQIRQNHFMQSNGMELTLKFVGQTKNRFIFIVQLYKAMYLRTLDRITITIEL